MSESATTDFPTLFEDSKSFSMYIEKMVKEKAGISHLDAILEYCSKAEIDPKELKGLIRGALKDKLEANYQDLNFLPKSAKLDV